MVTAGRTQGEWRQKCYNHLDYLSTPDGRSSLYMPLVPLTLDPIWLSSLLPAPYNSPCRGTPQCWRLYLTVIKRCFLLFRHISCNNVAGSHSLRTKRTANRKRRNRGSIEKHGTKGTSKGQACKYYRSATKSNCKPAGWWQKTRTPKNPVLTPPPVTNAPQKNHRHNTRPSGLRVPRLPPPGEPRGDRLLGLEGLKLHKPGGRREGKTRLEHR